jgi:hypothetical protein
LRRSREQLGSGALAKLRAIKATPAGQTGLYDQHTGGLQDRCARKGTGTAERRGGDDRREERGPSRIRLSASSKTRSGRSNGIGIGIGPDTDEPELQQITKPAGGKAFVAKDPGRITDVLFGALSRLTGAA